MRDFFSIFSIFSGANKTDKSQEQTDSEPKKQTTAAAKILFRRPSIDDYNPGWFYTN